MARPFHRLAAERQHHVRNNNNPTPLTGRGGIAHPEEVGKRIMQARTALGLTQAEFAAQVELSRSHLNHYEMGRHLTLKGIRKVAGATPRPVEWFLTGRMPDLDTLALANDPEIDRMARRLLPAFLTSNSREVTLQLAAALRQFAAAVTKIAADLDASVEKPSES